MLYFNGLSNLLFCLCWQQSQYNLKYRYIYCITESHLINFNGELSDWMFQNKFKLNDKTKFLVIGSGLQKSKINSKSIAVGGHAIKSAAANRNLGVWIDKICPWHIRSIKSAYLHTSKFANSLGHSPF